MEKMSTKMALVLALVLTNFAVSLQGRELMNSERAAYRPQTFPGAYGLVFGTPRISGFPHAGGAAAAGTPRFSGFPGVGGAGLPLPGAGGAGLPLPGAGGAGLPQPGVGGVPGMPHAAVARKAGSGN